MTKAHVSAVDRRWSRFYRGHLSFWLWLLLSAALTSFPAVSAELIMYESLGCMWCRQWHAEIGPGYAKSAEGQRAPLLKRMLTDPPIAGLTLASPVTLTPTFVLTDSGREVGRIAGYPGSDFFYPLLEDLLKKLPNANKASAGDGTASKTMNP